ncbi:hypothetical protein FHS83_001812 [Rhizomicrobium palustre]|uniref:Uncharacterized protein n=1 Tax=Rhizomicrobium palustre TaxID=189966 RepID=A0A846MY05_9PROT|nr:hypothetical protein [Rhizomicrobium palustre]NIK88494.1 hypothetical protein [Rhizomicrobium palustre]
MRQHFNAIGRGLALLAFAVLPAWGGDLAAKSTPGVFWIVWGNASAKYVTADEPKEGAAQRVSVIPKPKNLWDAGTVTAVPMAVKKGDVLILKFEARAQKPAEGSDLVMVTAQIYEAGVSGRNVSRETHCILGKQWRTYYVSGTAKRDYPVGTLSAGMLLGSGEQVIDFGRVTILNMGPGFDPKRLPRG